MYNLRNETNEQKGGRDRDKPRNRLITIEKKSVVTKGEVSG